MHPFLNTGKTYDLDIICYATGFDVAKSNSIDVRGIGGKSLSDYYEEEGGPTAYMGTTTPDFPNWFSLLGPNTVTGEISALYYLINSHLSCSYTGHASVICSEEIQVCQRRHGDSTKLTPVLRSIMLCNSSSQLFKGKPRASFPKPT